MIYPKTFEEKIGFSIIRELLHKKCISTLGQSYLEKIGFIHSYNKIKLLIDQTDEFKTILLYEEHFPSKDYIDMIGELQHLKIEGSYIEEDALMRLQMSLETIEKVLLFFKKHGENYPNLQKLASNYYLEQEILKEIDRIIDDKGEVRSTASESLKKIRKEIASKESRLGGKIQEAYKHALAQGLLKDDAQITIRNGRSVIPVPHSNKRQIKGFIQDESASGQTVYIEPAEVFELNNEIRELEYAEKREIIKILKTFSDFLRPYISELIRNYLFLGLIDFIRAKAKLAIELNGVKPLIVNKPYAHWRSAVHPILYLTHKAQNKEIIPLDITLNKKQRIIIISGPNAGGKSVCLKSVGLLQYMFQCGLLVPVKENSEFGIFKNILIDIGDEQSLENDLSTYSSHLLNIKNFISMADQKSLFLIDEFGTGTEPQLGGAIAEASLERISTSGAYGVVTTHYANLKLMANSDNGIVNGAMLFDTKKIRPLYKLRIGKPGSSFAFEIARKIGLEEELLNRAKDLSGKVQSEFDYQLQQLETEKYEVDEKQKSLKVADDFLAEMIEKYTTLHNELQANKKQLINEAKREAKNILKNANKLIEQTIREIKENQAEKVQTINVRQRLSEKIQKLETPEKQTPKKQEKPKQKKNKKLTIGDTVKIQGQQTVGRLEQIQGNQALVSFDSLKIRVPVSKLEYVNMVVKDKKKAAAKSYNSIINELNEKAAAFKPSIDIRGKRAEEALMEVSSLVDDALLVGARNLEVLHGKGDGILRTVIREWLAASPEVASFKDQHIELGGSGITVIKLK